MSVKYVTITYSGEKTLEVNCETNEEAKTEALRYWRDNAHWLTLADHTTIDTILCSRKIEEKKNELES